MKINLGNHLQNMPDKEWYREWFSSPYYDLMYFNRNEDEAEKFMQRLVQRLGIKPNAAVMNVACGKGRYSKVLAAMGFYVTGIDLSFAFIEEAKKNESENLEFFQHDMRLPFRINYFDAVFNFFTSFGYFRTEREHNDAIRTVANSLKLNGLFVIDYLNVHYAEEHLIKSEEINIQGAQFLITRWHDEEHFFKQIQVVDENHVIKHLFTEKVAKFSPGDFTDMLAYQGMQVQQMFGDYALGNYHVKNSPRMIIVARKVHQ